MKQIRETPQERTYQALSLRKTKNGFRSKSAASRTSFRKSREAYLFESEQPNNSQRRIIFLNKEQAKSILLAKRDAYMQGQASFKAALIKSLIQRLVHSLMGHLQEQPTACLTCISQVALCLDDCYGQSVEDFKFDQ